MEVCATKAIELDPVTQRFYCRSLAILTKAELPFLVGGAYALQRYTSIERHTKDFDIFVRKEDCHRTLEIFSAAGYQTELTFPHWLGKAFCGGDFIDVIFSSGNGIASVDDEWFEHAMETEVLGMPVRVCPPEEILWSKMFIMERERFDGADVAHLLLACAEALDWHRLFRRFGPYWQVLLSHLILFQFIYPSHCDRIPGWVMKELTGRLDKLMASPPSHNKVCQGTILSRAQYLFDIDRWGYLDARLTHEKMTREQIAHWTAAIEER